MSPSRIVVIIEAEVDNIWRARVSDWLVRSGCLYMMAWGADCSAWDDAVDLANLEQFDYQVPDDRSVMTTWHEDETLQEVFLFAKTCANHSTVEIGHTLLLHISESAREQELMQAYALA